MRSQKETEELVRITENLQETIGHGKYLERLTEKDMQEVVAKLSRLRQLTQGDFSESLKDGRMSVRIRHDDKGREGEWVLTWFNDGFPSMTRDMGMSQLPDFIYLLEYIHTNPGDGGIEFLENAGPRFIVPYARPYYLRFYPEWKDETPQAGN